MKPKLSSREKEKLKAREWVEFRNYTRSCYVYGKSHILHGRGAKFAADLYRQNWDGCRDLWKLQKGEGCFEQRHPFFLSSLIHGHPV